MLELAPTYLYTPEYKQRLDYITFIQSDIIQYLQKSPDKSINLAIMKYTIDHMPEIDTLFSLLAQKLKDNGVLISNIGVLSPELKSISTNARFLHNGEEFPENETRILQDGDNFTVKFFKES
jgi:ubiquinone/menaquinone biosynthesis C-methylase UbiE